jgi:hypothetical protein
MRAWGVRDAATHDGAVVADANDLRAELREAYRRGRRDEHRRHRRSPLIVGGLLAIAAIGAVMLYFTIQQGSFSRGGQVVDAQLAHATNEVIPNAVNSAADGAGTALKSAGERLKTQGAQSSAPATASNAGK